MTDRMDTCASCRFFKRFPDMVGADEGECRHRSPEVHARLLSLDQAPVYGATWPPVQAVDWCGEYQPKR